MMKAKRSDRAPMGSDFDLLEMLEGSIALVGIYDQHEVLRYANAAFRQAYFVDPTEQIDWQGLMRRNFAAGRGTIIETDDIEKWIASVRSRRGKSRQRTYESDLHDGRFIWVTETMRDDGWIVYAGTDITLLNVSERHLRLANEKLSRQSSTDELTGVSNRRHILAKLQDILDSGQESWACLVDIDHFKAINDRYGHQVGDAVLVSIAQTARKTIALRDGFGRVGGEEFLILFPSQSFEDASATLHRLQETVRILRPSDHHADLRITLSGGLTRVSSADTQSEVLRRADLGLYCAKARGRDQIRLAASADDRNHSRVD